MSEKIAVVTGGNKGIGYGIVKELCDKFDGKVYLTARNESLGKNAVSKLQELGFTPLFHQLDITNQDSINKFRDYVKEHDGGIDVLINNAGIIYLTNEPLEVIGKQTVDTNYYGTLHVCQALFPLLRTNAQVVNVSSSSGHLSRIACPKLRVKLGDPNITLDQLSQLMDEFVRDAKYIVPSKSNGCPAYTMSKVGISALTFIQQRDFDNEVENRNISVNAVHPGVVSTDMTRHKGTLTIEEGARAPVFLGLGGHGLKGKYVWKDCTVLDWRASKIPEIH